MVNLRPCRCLIISTALLSLCLAWSAASPAEESRKVTFSQGRVAMSLANVHSYELTNSGEVMVIRSPEAADAEVRFSFRRLTDPVFADRAKIDELVCLEAERRGADCWEVTQTRETFFYGNATTAVNDDETFVVVQGMRSARDGVFSYTLQFPEWRLADEDYSDRPLDLLTELIERVYRLDDQPLR